MEIRVRNKKWSEDRFFAEREKVLSMWPTGKEVDLKEAIAYHKSLPDHKVFPKVVERLRKEGRTVVFPRAGTPILEQEIELNRTLIEAGLVLVPVTPDSYSRLGHFDKARRGLEESIRTGQPKLNGYPTVVHGVKNTRKVVENTDAALDHRLSNVGGVRLIAEIAFASGITGALVDPLLTFNSYEKKATAAECIEEYQYIHRLIGYYADRGVTISVDIDGPLTSLQYPMSIDIASVIVVALVAAEQGVRSIIPWSPMCGYVPQDIAWARLTRTLVREYLDRFGYGETATPGLFAAQIPVFPYPQDMGWSFAFVNYSAMVAALAGAEGVYLRTIDEAAGIPVKEAHAVTYRSAKWIFDVVRPQKINFDNDEIGTEARFAEMEIRAIMEKVLELGDGDVVVGYERGVQAGVIDSPLCGNLNVKSNVLGIRDNNGACRYLGFGNLPIPDEAKEFHRQKVAEREKAEGRKMDHHIAIEDFRAFSRGGIKGVQRAGVPPVRSVGRPG